MEKNQYQKLLLSLETGKKVIHKNGVNIIVKECFDRKEGQLDPRVSDAMKITGWDYADSHMDTIDPLLQKNLDKLCGPRDAENYSPLEMIRYQFSWHSENLSPDVENRCFNLETDGFSIPVWQYKTPDCASHCPAVIYFHGGGFAAGDIAMSQNQCRLLAKKIHGIVFSVDYPLSPDCSAVEISELCYQIVCMLYHNSDSYGIDPAQIAVAGDSAGGFIAMYCTVRSLAEHQNMIYRQFLIYPLLSWAVRENDPDYCWNPDEYDNPRNDARIRSCCTDVRDFQVTLNSWTLKPGEDAFDSRHALILTDQTHMVPTLLLTAEYDFLRLQSERYAAILKSLDIPVRIVRYGGLTHGNFDRLGYVPQTEDMVCEMASAMLGTTL